MTVDIPSLVAKHYIGGEFAYLTPKGVLTECECVGDGLFAFLVHEAQDAQDVPEYLQMLDRAEQQIRSLRAELETHALPEQVQS